MQALSDDVRTPQRDGDSIERHVVRPPATHEFDIAETEDGQTELTVPVSSTSEMRSGRVITEAALESMVDQLDEATVGMWDDHGLDEYGWPEYRREDLYGAWVGGEIEDGVLYATVRLREGDPRSEDLVDQLEQGMPVGFSIGYIALDDEWVESEDGERREILRVDLMEISPVGIPDNTDAYATAGRLVAHSLAEAGVDIDRQSASVLADSVTHAFETMTDTHEGEDTPDDEEEQSNEQPAETHQDAEETAAAIIGIFNAHNDAANEDAEAWLEENAAGDKDDDEDESAEEDEDDEEESAGISDIDVDAATGSTDGISSEQFDQLLSTVEGVKQANEELREENEELRATVDRLESQSRESEGRRGFSTGPAADEKDVDESEQSNEDTEHRNAYEAFQED